MRFNTPYQPYVEMVGVFAPLDTNDKKIALNNLLRNGEAHWVALSFGCFLGWQLISTSSCFGGGNFFEG